MIPVPFHHGMVVRSWAFDTHQSLRFKEVQMIQKASSEQQFYVWKYLADERSEKNGQTALS